MVRKSSRTSIKSVDKAKVETPKRNRTRASARLRRNSSEGSDEEVKSTITNSPTHSDKDSSEDESTDKDSKKPFKKRIRGRNRESPVVDDIEEVKEGKKGKGKSKGRNKSNSNTADEGIESEHVQVTNESPICDTEEPQTIESSTEQIVSTIVTTGETSDGEAEAVESQHSATTTESPIENIKVEENVTKIEEIEGASCLPPITEEKTKDISETCEEDVVKTEEVKLSETENQRNVESQVEESENEDSRAYQTKGLVKTDSVDNVDIKVEVETNEKEPTLSYESEAPVELLKNIEKKEETKKKITLKRLTDVKQVISDELKIDEQENQEVAKDDTWVSTYESKESEQKPSETQKQEKVEELDDKVIRKKISLKRPTVEEIKDIRRSMTRDDVASLGRSSSLQESHVEKQRRKSKTEPSESRRRHSTAFESPVKENEEKLQIPKKHAKPIKLVRNLNYEDSELATSVSTNKKFKWGKCDILSDMELLNLGSLKEICPNIEFLADSEVNLETLNKESKALEKERQKSFNEMEAEEMEKIEAELNAEPEDFEEKENIIAMNRKISIVDDTASKLKPPPSPSKNPVSDVLFITNLVRPFTVKQLRELLERTGKIREEGFWTDRIKSKCYVQYETTEEAEATRNALHGVHWPIGNGKKLIIDFSTVDALETAKNPPIVVRKEKSPEKENKKPDKEDNRDQRNGDRAEVKEWESKEKGKDHRRTSRSRSRERQRKHSRRSYTPEDYHNKRKKKEEPVPQKAMDDLFLKTKATPSIYWQPLSPEEIALKQQQRQARLEENKRRMEEIRSSNRREPQRDRDRGRERNFRRR